MASIIMVSAHRSYVDWKARTPGNLSERQIGNCLTSSATRSRWNVPLMPRISSPSGSVLHSRTNVSGVRREGFGRH